MAYVVTLPTAAQVKAEIDSDPLALGYAAMEAAQNWNGIRDALNQADRQQITRRTVAVHELSEAVVYSEFAALTQANRDAMSWIISCAAGGQGLDPENDNIRGFFLGVFTAGSTTRANLVGLTTRQGSRAEFLWGDGVVVNDTLVEAAARLP